MGSCQYGKDIIQVGPKLLEEMPKIGLKWVSCKLKQIPVLQFLVENKKLGHQGCLTIRNMSSL